MNTKDKNKKRKILRKIYGALSLSSAMFVFQACYGPPRDHGVDVFIQGIVLSKTTNLPISGIRVSIENNTQYHLTDSSGVFKMYVQPASEYKIKFEDTDTLKNGSFHAKDTILKIVDERTYLNISLNDK